MSDILQESTLFGQQAFENKKGRRNATILRRVLMFKAEIQRDNVGFLHNGTKWNAPLKCHAASGWKRSL